MCRTARRSYAGACVVGLLLLSCRLAFGAIEDQPLPKAKPTPAPPAPVLTRPPEIREFASATYPRELFAQAVGGEAVLLLDIDARGQVIGVELVSATHPAFGPPAMAAAKRLVFTAAEVDGKPAPIRIEYRYIFEPSIAEADAISGEWPQPVTLAVPVNFAGVIREAGDRRPIAGAVVRVNGLPVAEADGEGRFEVRGVAPGSFKVRISGAQYQPYETEETVAPNERLDAKYYLVRVSTNPFETVVRTRSDRREVSKIQLDRGELSKVPGTFGDPLRVIENLPGMARTPGGMGGTLLVRGARPTDSRVFLDGAEIPMLYHFGGLTSVVNAQFLERIDFYPGGFGARHGNATAGIVDVASRDLDCDLWRGSLKVDFVDSAAYTCAPASGLKLAVAARRSYVDAILPLVLDRTPRKADQGVVTAAPVYWDYQAKVQGRYGAHTADLFAFGSDDQLKLVQTGSAESVNFHFGMQLGFHRLMFRDRWQLGENATLTSTVTPGMLIQRVEQSSPEITLDTNYRLKVYSTDWREDLTAKLGTGLTVNAGLDHHFGVASLDLNVPFATDLRLFPSPVFDFTDTQHYGTDLRQFNQGYWMELVYEPVAGLKAVPGLRVDRWDFHHTQALSFEPRATVRWQLPTGTRTTAKAAYGLYEKLPEPYYLMDQIGNPGLKPERAQHFVVGLEQILTDLVSVDVQGFYNLRSHLPASSRSVTYESGKASAERWASTGTGRSLGLEVLLRHLATQDGRFYGWIAYTLSRSLRRDRDPGTTYVITRAEGGDPQVFAYSERATREYLEPFDQTHILTLVGQWVLPWGVEAGLRFRLVSGNPYTALDRGAVFYDNDSDSYRLDLSDVSRNSSRMPTFDQLDVRIEKTWTYDLWKLTAYLEVINAYNAKNVEQYQYDYRYRRKVPIALLPVLPIIGVKGEF